MLNFDFSEKRVGIASLQNFMYGFSRKMFLILYSINLTDQTSLPDCLYFLKYWSICALQLLLN